MARFLFVVPEFAGHINPTIPVAAELARRAHETAWTGIPGLVNELLPSGSHFIPASPTNLEQLGQSLTERFRGMRGAAALRFLWYEALLPMARLMVDGVRRATEEFAPDVLVVDQQALAGAVVARQLGVPWATMATTSAELTDPLAAWPIVANDIREARVALQVEAGIPRSDAEEGDLLFSPLLVLACTTEALVGAVRTFPEHYRFIGACTSGRAETDDFPWSWLEPSRPCVLVTLGTINFQEGERFFAVAAEALASLPVQGVIVAPPELVPDPPANVLVRRWVPQLALLDRMAAVVTHAGHNTVCETLAVGLPLVVAPIQNDQSIVAEQVVQAGCGVKVSFPYVNADQLRGAIQRALTDPDLRAAANVARRSFAAAPGPVGAADHLERLAFDLAPAARG